jgi:hypothetical protein
MTTYRLMSEAAFDCIVGMMRRQGIIGKPVDEKLVRIILNAYVDYPHKDSASCVKCGLLVCPCPATASGEHYTKFAPESVSCCTCGKPMVDRGGAKQWCGEKCRPELDHTGNPITWWGGKRTQNTEEMLDQIEGALGKEAFQKLGQSVFDKVKDLTSKTSDD